MTIDNSKILDSFYRLSFLAVIIMLSCIVVAMVVGAKRSGPVPVCYDTGNVQVVSVHDSGIQRSIGYQYEVRCSDGEIYWR